MQKLINKLHVSGAKSYIEKLAGFYFYRLLYGPHFINMYNSKTT